MATLFTTKKNIKAETLEYMQENEFKDLLFGFVEIDDSFDLAKFVDMEMHFEHIFKKLQLDKMLHKEGLKFRIRKIRGNNAGRYYYKHKELVVDINYVSSFIHELGHLIDYQSKLTVTNLCIQKDFDAVTKMYCTMFLLTAEKGGYYHRNKRYYMDRKEIFARTFEQYIARKFGHNVITKTKEMYADRETIYPRSDMFDYMVDDYFNKLFAKGAQF